MLRLSLAVVCVVLYASCGPVDRPATVTKASNDASLSMPGNSVELMLKSGRHVEASTDQQDAEQEARAKAAYRAEGQRMLKMATDQAAERQQRSSRTSQIIVVPAQANPGFKLPSEIAREQEAAKVAKIAARKAYCEEHPVECETLAAAEATRDAVQLLQFSR